MTEILALLQNIAPVVSAAILQQMSHVIYGMLVSNGRITMLEISRWTEAVGSYRTIQRLYHTPLLWLQIQWLFFTLKYHSQIRGIFLAGKYHFIFQVIHSQNKPPWHKQNSLPGYCFLAQAIVAVNTNSPLSNYK